MCVYIDIINVFSASALDPPCSATEKLRAARGTFDGAGHLWHQGSTKEPTGHQTWNYELRCTEIPLKEPVVSGY